MRHDNIILKIKNDAMATRRTMLNFGKLHEEKSMKIWKIILLWEEICAFHYTKSGKENKFNWIKLHK